MAKGMKILAKHRRWVSGAVITESISADGQVRRFTATVRGFRNFRLGEYHVPAPAEKIQNLVRNIRDRIDSGDDSVFEQKDFHANPGDAGRPRKGERPGTEGRR